MNEGRTVFAQLMDCLPKYEFDKCVRRYGGNVRVRSLATYEQFLVMAFAQLTWRESLRDIETCLRALGSKLYHSGIRKPTARSTLADANEKRDWRIFADFARILIEQVSQLYADEPLGAELTAAAYALDSTTIDLCLSLFPWAKFRRLRCGCQNACLARFARQLSHRGYHYPGPCSRRQHSRSDRLSSRFVLCDRSWLSGFCPIAAPASKRRLFCHPRSQQLPGTTPLFASREQEHRFAFGSDRRSHAVLCSARLSRWLAAHWLSRSPIGPFVGLSDQQLHRTGTDDSPTLLLPLADRTVLQMAQTTSADQSLLWHQRKRRANPTLDRSVGLSAGRYPQETSPLANEPLHFITNSQSHPFRKNGAIAGTFRTASVSATDRHAKSAVFTGLFNRTVVRNYQLQISAG